MLLMEHCSLNTEIRNMVTVIVMGIEMRHANHVSRSAMLEVVANKKVLVLTVESK